jgi:hypothetical protein
MWDLNPKGITDPVGFGELCSEYIQYYRDHMQQMQAMEVVIRGLFARADLEGALEIAKTSSLRGSLCLNLLWRPVYPFERTSPEYDAESVFDYENNYGAELLINSNGNDGDYYFVICYNYRDGNGIYTTADKAIPFAEHEKLILPEWFASNIRKIRNDSLKKNIPKKESLTTKVKRTFGF